MENYNLEDRIILRNGKQFILDYLRKKYVRLTPEECVRQSLVHYLVYDLNYPPGLICLEKERANKFRLDYRADIAIYNTTFKIILLAECKKSGTVIDEKTLDQLAKYNANCNAKLLVISNGTQNLCWLFNNELRRYESIPNIPPFGF